MSLETNSANDIPVNWLELKLKLIIIDLTLLVNRAQATWCKVYGIQRLVYKAGYMYINTWYMYIDDILHVGLHRVICLALVLETTRVVQKPWYGIHITYVCTPPNRPVSACLLGISCLLRGGYYYTNVRQCYTTCYLPSRRQTDRQADRQTDRQNKTIGRQTGHKTHNSPTKL